MQVMLMRLMSKGEYVIIPKGTKFTGTGKLGLTYTLCVRNKFTRDGGQTLPPKHGTSRVKCLLNGTKRQLNSSESCGARTLNPAHHIPVP